MNPSARILLVEDNPLNQKLALVMMKLGRLRTELANDGKEAVEIFKSRPEAFDLIFMDIQMPRMDGITATKLIRAHEKRLQADRCQKFETAEADRDAIGEEHRVPIVAMTAHATKVYREKCFAAGMDDFIAKPIKKDRIFEIITRWVSRDTESNNRKTAAMLNETL